MSDSSSSSTREYPTGSVRAYSFCIPSGMLLRTTERADRVRENTKAGHLQAKASQAGSVSHGWLLGCYLQIESRPGTVL